MNKVHFETSGSLGILTLANPPLNLLSGELIEDLRAAVNEVKRTPLRALLLRAEGKVFCAGADMVAFDLVEHPEGWLGLTRGTVAKPTMAAIAGPCVAGGLELALWCDLRVAGADAVFGCFERRFGVPLVDGGTQRLPRIVGLGRALDMILTGRAVGAAEALRIGLVDRVVPAGTELDEALRLADAIAAFPGETMRSDRRAVYEGLGRPLGEGLTLEAEPCWRRRSPGRLASPPVRGGPGPECRRSSCRGLAGTARSPR